ncbi:MAG: NHLP bacteriocin system secretion protein [Chlamydiota bacterium]
MTEEEKDTPDFRIREYKLNDFQENLVVVSYKSWVVILSLIGLMFIAGLWTIFGSISIQVMGRGIALTTQGVLEVPSKVQGRVTDLSVERGEVVKTSDKIATIFDLQHDVGLRNAQKKLEILEKDYLDAQLLHQKELERKLATLNKDATATLFEVEERQEGLPDLKKDLESKQRLYEEGLISAFMLQNAEVTLMEEEIKIQNLQVKLLKIDEELKQSYKSDELKNYRRLYNEALNEVKQYEAKSSYFEILSPIQGEILELQVRVGEEIKEGQSIVLMEKTLSEQKDYLFYCYASSSDGSKIKVGSEAYLELSLVDPQKYGYLKGKVTSVSQYPVSDSRIFSVVHSEELLAFLKGDNKAVMEIVVKPEKDLTTPSGFSWTSGNGPNIEIQTGLLASVRLTVDKRRPISYIFPVSWFKGESHVDSAKMFQSSAEEIEVDNVQDK